MPSQIVASSKYYIPILKSRHRYNVMFGGRSSAKSYMAALKGVLLMRTERNFKGCCLRKIYADIKDSQFATMESIINQYGWSDEFHIIKSPLEITHIPTGNKILARGLDKAHKLKSINNLTWLWIEEADEIKLEDFIKSDTSVRHPDNNVLLQTVLTFNPESEEGWINSYFMPPKVSYEKDDGSHTYIESTVKNCLVLHTTYKHNEFCSQGNIEVIERLEKLGKDSNYYRVYVLGLWGNALKGLVFENINFVDEFPKREDCKKYGFGLDFGFTNDPTAIVRCALAHGEIFIEEMTYKTGLVNCGSNSIDENLKKFAERNDLIIADSAEPKSIEELNREGNRVVGVKKGKDSVEAGITLMKQYKINIVGSSINLKKELKSYKYQENKEGGQSEFSNKPIDEWNHCFTGDTLVNTFRGKVRIDSLNYNDKILTREGFKKIIWHGATRHATIWEVELSNGSKLNVTGNHNIFTHRGKIKVDCMRYGDILYSVKDNEEYTIWNKLFSMAKSITASQNQETIQTGTILSAREVSIIETYMKCTLVKSLKITTFITRILTLLIIQLITFYAFIKKNILRFTQKETRESVQIHKDSTLKTLGILQKSGTLLRKVLNGILSMVENVLIKDLMFISNVKFAEMNLNHKIRHQNSVPINASQNGEEILELTTPKSNAKNVERFSQSTDIISKNSVRVLAVRKTERVEKVYNIHVEGCHEYYANEVLVANCIDAARYWCWHNLKKSDFCIA